MRWNPYDGINAVRNGIQRCFYHVSAQREVGSLPPAREPSLNLSWTSRMVRHKFYFYKPHGLWYFITAAQAKTAGLVSSQSLLMASEGLVCSLVHRHHCFPVSQHCLLLFVSVSFCKDIGHVRLEPTKRTHLNWIICKDPISKKRSHSQVLGVRTSISPSRRSFQP